MSARPIFKSGNQNSIASNNAPEMVQPPSYMLTIATLLAYTALYLTTNSPALPVFSVLLLGTHITMVRFDRPTLVAWLLRLVVFAAIASLNKGRPAVGADWLFDGRVVSIAGQLLAAELLIQQWTRPATRVPHGVIVLLSCLVFMAACNTFEQEHYIHVFTPVFMLFIVLALRDVHRRGEAHTDNPAIPPRVFALFRARHWAAMVLALGLGASVHFGIREYRSEINMLGIQLLRSRQMAQAVGMSTQPQLGSTFETQDSPARVLRLTNYNGSPHLRSMAFDTYSKGRWGPILEQRRATPASAEQLGAGAKGERATATRLVSAYGILFAPLDAAGITAPDDTGWNAEQGGPLQGPELAPYDYEIVTVNEEFNQGPLCAPLTEEQRARCLQLPPELDPRVRALATRIAGHLPTKPDQVEAVVEYLMKNHKYSRETRRGAGDPVSNFLLSKRAAHCEYFASAATILLRCLGVPTRYATGFFAHEEAAPGVTIVRQRDAHAWAESWIDGFGWVTVEATPASGQPDSLAEELPWWTRTWEWIQDRFAALREMEMSRTVPSALAGLALAGIILHVLLTRRRKAAPAGGFSYSSPDEELQAVASRFERLMERHQLSCPEHRTWQEHALAVEKEMSGAALPIDLARAQEFLDEYNRVRFGRPGDRVAIAHLSTTLQQLEADTRRRLAQPRRIKEP